MTEWRPGQTALDEAVRSARKRETFGRAISRPQSIQNMAADMAEIEAARLLVYKKTDNEPIPMMTG